MTADCSDWSSLVYCDRTGRVSAQEWDCWPSKFDCGLGAKRKSSEELPPGLCEGLSRANSQGVSRSEGGAESR